MGLGSRVLRKDVVLEESKIGFVFTLVLVLVAVVVQAEAEAFLLHLFPVDAGLCVALYSNRCVRAGRIVDQGSVLEALGQRG